MKQSDYIEWDNLIYGEDFDGESPDTLTPLKKTLRPYGQANKRV